MESNSLHTDECVAEGPQSALEHQLVTEFLEEKGYSWEDLQRLPEAVALELRKGACMYASLKLAELEARSRFRDEIRGPSG